jgi:DNA-binding MarR family transcriptional regulator
VIDESGGMIHGGAIARRIGISRQAVSRTLARFDERGMIRIYADPWMRSVRLTDEGRRVLHQAKDALTGVFAAVRRVNVEAQRRIITAEGAIRVELHRPHHPRTWLERYMQPELWDDDDGL